MKFWRIPANNVGEVEPGIGNVEFLAMDGGDMLVASDTQPHAAAMEQAFHKSPAAAQSTALGMAGREDRADLQLLAAAVEAKLDDKRRLPKSTIFARLSARGLVPTADAVINTAVFPVGHERQGEPVRPYWDHYSEFKRDDPQVNDILTKVVDGTAYTVGEILAAPA